MKAVAVRCALVVCLFLLGGAGRSQAPAQTGKAPPAGESAPEQSSPPAPSQATKSSLTVNAKLVVVPAVVRDKRGALIKDLGKADFAITVDEKPQTVRYFDRDNDVPLTLGLLVDISQSQRDVLDDEREGSRVFLDELLTPAGVVPLAGGISAAGANAAAKGSEPAKGSEKGSDRAFVMQFAHEIELLQDVTDQRPALTKALRELGTQGAEFHNTDPGDTRDEEGRRVRRGGTALYDALFLAGDEVMAKQKGRRALVVLTDGVDNGSKESLEDAIESAQRSDTVVYAIFYKGQEQRSGGFGGPGGPGGGGRRGGGGWPGGGGGGYPGGGGNYPGGGGGTPNGGGQNPGSLPSRKPHIDGKRVLDRLCGETGGRVFVLSKKQTVQDAYKQIGEELRSQYRLGFTPDGAAATDKYHRLEVTLIGAASNRKLEVQTREGYYPGK